MSDNLVTHKDLGEIRERLARIEAHTQHISGLANRVTVLEAWKTRIIAVSSLVAAVVTYFASELKRLLFNSS
jgi:glycyl-tRNA synthetase beta subunit